jgi:hypothetical protein
MTATALAELIWAEADLQTAVKQIAIRTATIDISAIDAPTTEAIDFNWFHLLRCASVFVATDSEFYFDRVFKSCTAASLAKPRARRRLWRPRC